MPPGALEERRKERESNPQGREAHPFSRRGTAPVAVLPRRIGDSGRSRTCIGPGKNRELWLSYGAVMWSAGIEPATPRVSGGRSTFRAPTTRAEEHGRGWTRTSSLLFVRQALSAIELLARDVRTPGQGVEPRSPRSGRGVLPVGRSRTDRGKCLSVHLPCRRSTQRQLSASCQAFYVYATRLPFDPGSPAGEHAHPRTGVLRGGALEPEPRTSHTKRAGKSKC